MLAAEVDEDDEASRMRFFSAVAPIDDVRAERKPSARTDSDVPSDGEGSPPSDGGGVEAPPAAPVDDAKEALLPAAAAAAA